jgi:transposase
MDMGPGYAKSTRTNAPQATVCIDSFHVAKLGGEALDEVRRDYWNELRTPGDQNAAKRFKDARAGRCSNAPRTSPTARLSR